GVGALRASWAAAAWVFAPSPWRLSTGMEAAAADRTLLRGLVLALAPLAPAHLLLNFELAQHRFRICAVAVAGTVVYLVGVFLRHPTPLAVAGWLGGSSLAVVLTLAVALWNDQTRPAALAPEPDA
ncbi:MAG: hypothetical protein KBA51_09290, partial [Kiritimatiellae bacterium]|nr:hypothetical protein [Kiritimatiellia bacterium]